MEHGEYFSNLQHLLAKLWTDHGPEVAYAHLGSLTPTELKSLVMLNVGASLR